MSVFRKNKFGASGQRNLSGAQAEKFLIILILVLLVAGLIFLASASSVTAYEKFQGDAYRYFKHQILAVGLGLIAFLFFIKFDYHRLKKYAFWFLFISIGLLLLVFIPSVGAHYNKARSWINIFGLSLQPAEFVKISFLLYLSAWLDSRQDRLHNFSEGIGPFVVVLGIIAVLMFLQPDIGTLSIIGLTSLIVYFVGGGQFKHLFFIIIFSLLIFAVMVAFKPYQLDRFRCMVNPNFDTQGVCYQNNQALIAVGSGGIFGRGLGMSRQKFMYIPEIQGDSIFAVIAEETGLVIGVILIMAYLYLFYLGYRISRVAVDDFGKILAIGIVSWIVLQAFVNIGGMIGLMPMTGVPLPLISYGGTSIMATLIALGILINIGRHNKSTNL